MVMWISQWISDAATIHWTPRKWLFALNVLTITMHCISAVLSSIMPVNSFNVFQLTYSVLHRTLDGHIDMYIMKTFSHKLYLRWLVVTFFLLSAYFQWLALMSTKYRYFDRVGLFSGTEYVTIEHEMHSHSVPRLVHWLRFVEYSFSASVMLIGISLLTGITDVNELACIFTLCAVTQLLGLLCEINMHTDQHYQAILAHVAGWCTFIMSYGTIASHYLTGVYVTRGPQQHLPWWVHMIVVSMSIMFSIFGAVQVGRLLLPELLSVYAAELVYVTMSVLTKTALGWMILGIALSPNQ
jgi:hypothetical protein